MNSYCNAFAARRSSGSSHKPRHAVPVETAQGQNSNRPASHYLRPRLCYPRRLCDCKNTQSPAHRCRLEPERVATSPYHLRPPPSHVQPAPPSASAAHNQTTTSSPSHPRADIVARSFSHSPSSSSPLGRPPSQWPSSYVPRFLALPSRSLAGMLFATLAESAAAPAISEWLTLCPRYTDLQPVGMGAFGLVWYVIFNGATALAQPLTAL